MVKDTTSGLYGGIKVKYGECPDCGRVWLIDEKEDDVILMPWPHIECPKCGGWIPLF